MDQGTDAASTPTSYNVHANITGLIGTLHLTLDDDEELEIAADGQAMFTTVIAAGQSFRLSVTGHPYRQYCGVAGGPGPHPASASPIEITCQFGDVNPISRDEYDAAGDFESRTRWEFTEDMRGVALERRSTGVGADGDWFTTDDLGTTATYFDYFPASPEDDEETDYLQRFVQLSGLGVDGIPRTADDEILEYYERRLDSEGMEIVGFSGVGAGVGGVWFTDNDVGRTSTRWAERTYDSMGRVTCLVARRAGPDGMIDTGDDTLDEVTMTEYVSLPGLGLRGELHTYLNGDGGDGVFCEMHDPVEGAEAEYFNEEGARVLRVSGTRTTSREYDADGRETQRVTRDLVGEPDLLSGESDDVVTRVTLSYTDEADFTVQLTCNHPGPDGDWFTGDEYCNRGGARFRIVDSEGRVVGMYLYGNAPDVRAHGPDNVLGTPDDIASAFISSTYEDDLHRCDVSVSGPGPNGTWDTVDCGNNSNRGGALDDVLTEVTWRGYDGAGRLTHRARSNAPGANGVWATDDDVLSYGGSNVIVRAHLDDGFYVESQLQGPGVDGVPFAGGDDDTDTTRYELRRYNPIIGEAEFSADLSGPGLDGMFYTCDDELTSYDVTVYDRSGNQAERRRYVGPGPDGDWYTGDDLPEYITHYALAPFANPNR